MRTVTALAFSVPEPLGGCELEDRAGAGTESAAELLRELHFDTHRRPEVVKLDIPWAAVMGQGARNDAGNGSLPELVGAGDIDMEPVAHKTCRREFFRIQEGGQRLGEHLVSSGGAYRHRVSISAGGGHWPPGADRPESGETGGYGV